MSKVVGYARVSTKEQNLNRQIRDLSEYVQPDMIVTDKASGKDLDRPGYQSLKYGIGKLTDGDTLYITSLDRLSRNKEQAKKELQYFKENNIKIKILDIQTTLTDYPPEQAWVSDMVSNILIEVLSSIAQQERETIRKRQRQGIDVMPIDESTGKRISSKTGRPIGRPSAVYPPNWTEVYNQWKEKEITARKSMSLLNLKPNTFYKLVAQYEESINK